MLTTLSAGAIGVKVAGLDEGIAAARLGGFAGLEFSIAEVASIGVEEAKARFDAAGIVPAVFGVPVEWRGDEAKWKEGLADLPRLAKAAADLGCFRSATWIMPCSNDLTFEQNLAFHVERWKPIAEIMGEHGIAIGLEFVGPKTLREKFTYEFVYRADQMLEMGAQIGGNVGLLLDCFHWYTSGGTVENLKALSPSQIVYVHINDGAEGRSADEQIDGDRRLPAATGVIDIKGFFGALREIGYDGPVAAEPFYPPLNDLASDEERLRVVKGAIDKAMA